jgi:D-beta-D-heptose 7-phosphate kinase / D-beta-D-heptose 1-phosphate adenosyltransferase
MKFENFDSAKILVVGDVMLDTYWHGATSRISPEAPVPVVNVDRQEYRAGGAANVAINASMLGAKVKLHGLVGEDAPSNILSEILIKQGIESFLHPVPGSKMLNKLRVISRQQQVIRLDFEDKYSRSNAQLIMPGFRAALSEVNVVVLSDYLKGTLSAVDQLIEAANKQGVRVLVDPKGSDFTRYKGATIITPNLSELEAVVGHCSSEEELDRKANDLRDALDIETILLTRSEKGMILYTRGQAAISLPARAQDVFDVTGAGDTVIATLATAISSGVNLVEAVNMANYAAGVVVSKLGTSTVSIGELKRAMNNADAEVPRGICDENELRRRIEDGKARGDRMVMTNGCFDILHPGHIDYLERARKLGDRLIVAVNDDKSITRLKGSNRPINELTNRMKMLAALSCVDWVIPFSEDTPERLYSILLPDILVKGGDYSEDEIAGASQVKASGGKIMILPFLEGHSTSQLIEKISAREN